MQTELGVEAPKWHQACLTDRYLHSLDSDIHILLSWTIILALRSKQVAHQSRPHRVTHTSRETCTQRRVRAGLPRSGWEVGKAMCAVVLCAGS